MMDTMLHEIHEQPNWIESAIESERVGVAALLDAVKQRDIRMVVIAARGTSDNAAVYAKYLLETVVGIPVALAAPSVVTLYDAHLNLSSALVVGISQSGRGTDVVQVLSSARSSGALTACITNDYASPITAVSDHVLLCHAGEELAVAATKTYTTALAVVALLAAKWAEDRELAQGLSGAPALLRQALAAEPEIARVAERYRYMRECAVLARGINQATALEAALKMTETSYVVAKPYSGADFLHGPVAMVDPGFPCFVFAPPGRAFASMLELVVKIRERGGETIVFSSDEEALAMAVTPIRLPDGVPEMLSPLVYIVAGQLFAYYLSRSRGNNPDSPRGLTKVTLTR